MLAKLSELLFVEAISQFVSSLPAERRGWLAGLRDPQVSRALALLHARPVEEWTADSLAREVGMSRSAFAERFSSLVGQPPMQYLALRRMHLAQRSVVDIKYYLKTSAARPQSRRSFRPTSYSPMCHPAQYQVSLSALTR